jgi:hypothetical protein
MATVIDSKTVTISLEFPTLSADEGTVDHPMETGGFHIHYQWDAQHIKTSPDVNQQKNHDVVGNHRLFIIIDRDRLMHQRN